LFGPSDDLQWRPVGPSVRILRGEEGGGKVLAELEVGVVLGEVMAELRKIG